MQSILIGSIFKLKLLNFLKKLNFIIELNEFTYKLIYVKEFISYELFFLIELLSLSLSIILGCFY